MKMFFDEKAEKSKDGAITKDTLIADIISINPNNADILMESGMHCVGCPSSQAESLEEACAVHGLDMNKILEKLK